MPVNFDQIDEQTEPVGGIKPGHNGHKILSFLAENPSKGYTPTEIHEHIDIPMGSVGPTLKRLEERELVRHKGSYWSIATDDRLAALEASLNAVSTLDGQSDWDDVDWEEVGADEEEMAEWRAAQEDDA